MWEEPEWMHAGGWPGQPEVAILEVIPAGDTLLFYAYDGHPSPDSTLARVSFDHGQSYQPWRLLAWRRGALRSARFAIADGRCYAFLHDAQLRQSSVRISPDAGATWLPVVDTVAGQQHRGYARGQFVVRHWGGVDSAYWGQSLQRSTDGGQSWLPVQRYDVMGYWSPTLIRTIATTRTRLLVASRMPPSAWYDDWVEQVQIAVGLDLGAQMREGVTTPTRPRDAEVIAFALAADTLSETAILLEVRRDRQSTGPRYQPFLHRTTDGGETWEPYRSMTDGTWPVIQWGYPSPINYCQGKLWLVGWRHADSLQGDGVGVRLSANHGKSWYPLQHIPDSLNGLYAFSTQLVGRELRLYWNRYTVPEENSRRVDIRFLAGQLTPDTLLPVIVPQGLPDEVVDVGDTLQFLVEVTDNDTLYEAELHLMSLEGFLTVLPLVRGAGDRWQATLVVPQSGHYLYWFEAEDFWENRVLLPEGTEYGFTTRDLVDGASDFILPPSAFSLSAFPNPFNSTTMLRFALLAPADVRLTLYDVTGRVVMERDLGRLAAGEHAERIDAEGLASGIYFARLQAGEQRVVRKVALVR